MKPAEFSLSVKETIYDREGGCCYRCGTGIEWGSGNCQHRKARGSGGSRDKAKGLPSNGILLCAACHEWVERHRREALIYGWAIEQGGRDPMLVPALRWDGNWYRLDHDGNLIESLDGPTGSPPASAGSTHAPP